MTDQNPNLTMQMQADSDPASRRAYVQKWIARNQRRMAAGLGSAVLMLPLMANAQATDLVNATDVAGVNSATLNADGSANLTLTNGQVVNVAASAVQVAADGTIQITSAAADLVLEVVASVAEAGGAAAAGLDGAVIGAAAAGVGLAAVAAAGGGSDAATPEPAPTFLTAGALTGSAPTTAEALFGSFPDLQEGDRVFIRIGEDGDEVEVTVNEEGVIDFPEGADLQGAQGEQTISFRVERTSTVEGEDEDGNPTSEEVTEDIATGSADVVIDTVPPEIAITTPIAGDDVLNAAEQGANLTIAGTATGAEDGQVVTVSFNGQDYTATVADEAWTLDIPAADLAGLADGASFDITADVSDAAGNPAPQVTATLATDFTAEVTIDPVEIVTLNTFTGVTVEGGTTGVEEGRTVTVSFEGADYTGTVGADGRWSAEIPAAVIEGLADATEFTTAASVVDAAENTDSASVTSTTDFSLPALAITAPADGNVLNAADSAAALEVSGAALEGSVVTVTLGAATREVTADANNEWSVSFDAADLPDADGDFTITAATTIGGEPVNFTVTQTLDATAPVLEITTPIAGDDVLNAAEQGADLTIAGTATGAEDDQVVTVNFNGQDYRAFVEAEAWSVIVPGPDLAGLTDGDSVAITADVSDAAGNPATQATATLTTDFTAEITIDPVEIETLNTFTGVTVEGGTTGVEEGRSVTVSFEGEEYTGTVGADGRWSADIPAGVIDGLADATEFTFSASVSDVASNSDSATTTSTTDFSQPALAITAPEDGGFINADAAGDDIIVSGSALAGQEVTVTLNGVDQTITAQPDNTWEVTFPATDLPGADGPVTISATTTIDGTEINAPDVTLTLDTTAPTLTLDTAVVDDGLIPGLQLSGTTSDDVAEVALTVGGENFTAPVNGDGTWSTTISAPDLPAAAPGASVAVTANAVDAAGNAAPAQTASLTASSVTIAAPADGFTAGLDAFENGFTVSGTSTDLAEGTTVSISITEGPDDEGLTVTATTNAAGDWSVDIPASEVQSAADQAEFTVAASAPGSEYPAIAEASITINTDIPPQIDMNPLGEDGALILGDGGGTLDVAGSTRGVQEGQTVSISAGETELGTATVGADGSWSASITAPDLEAGEVLNLTAAVSNQSGRSVQDAGSVTGYEAAEFLLSGVDDVTVGPAAGAFEFTVSFDPRTQFTPEADGNIGVSIDGTLKFDTSVVSWEPVPAPQYVTGLSGVTNIADAATGEVVIAAAGFLSPTDPETGVQRDLADLQLVRFRLDHDDTAQPITVDVTGSAPGGDYSFVLGTAGVDTIAAGAVDTLIRGRGGDDMIDMSAAGVNTVVFEAEGAANGEDQITGFTAGGALADRIAFADLDNATLRGDGTQVELLATGDSAGANSGLVVFTTSLDTSDNAAVTSALTDLGLGADDVVYLIAGDDTDSELARLVMNSDGSLPALDDIETLAQFDGMGADDRAALGAGNFLDFAAIPEV